MPRRGSNIYKRKDGRFEVFQNGLDYFKYLKNEHDFDLIFLDIEMSGPNGVEIGRHIRNVMKNNITQIVYITAIRITKCAPFYSFLSLSFHNTIKNRMRNAKNIGNSVAF